MSGILDYTIIIFLLETSLLSFTIGCFMVFVLWHDSTLTEQHIASSSDLHAIL